MSTRENIRLIARAPFRFEKKGDSSSLVLCPYVPQAGVRGYFDTVNPLYNNHICSKLSLTLK